MFKIHDVNVKNENYLIVESHVQSQQYMRVAIVTETYPPEINGVAMTVGRLVNGLIQEGHSVQLVRPRQDWNDHPQMRQQYEEVLAAGIAIPQYPGLKFGLPAKSKLVQLWQQHRPDIVHVVTEGPLGWSAVSAARKLKIPVTSSFHTNFHNYTKHYKLRFFKNTITRYLRNLHNNTLATLVPTVALARELTRKQFKNLKVLSRGVDKQLFNPSRRDAALRKRWGISEDTVAVIYVGRLAAEKNIELLIKTYHAIHEKVPNSKLIVVGDGPLLATIKDQCKDAIFAGMRTGEDLAAHYASADIFVFPSKTETFGNVTIEALASGLAVVAYDYGAAAHIIKNNVNGITIKLDNEAAFISETTDLAFSPKKRTQIREKAFESVKEMDWENIHKLFVNILQSAITSAKISNKDLPVTTFVHDECRHLHPLKPSQSTRCTGSQQVY
jgi:glycosyltransferase involved in cell wall biosynthesis